MNDRREVVRLLLEVTINRATVRGRRFDPRRVEVKPSAFLQRAATRTNRMRLVLNRASADDGLRDWLRRAVRPHRPNTVFR